MLSLWCEGAFWPAVLSAVRKSTSDNNQSKIFGLLEGGRGGVELLQNTLAVGLYTALGYQVLGLELAFMVNAGIMIVLGVISWFRLPRETLLKSGKDKKKANREVLAGMKLTLKLPEVWLAGAAGFAVYMAYTSLPFFLTYLDELHSLPVLAVSIFGILSTSGGRIAVALPSGFIADKFLGGAAGGIRAGLFLVIFLCGAMLMLTSNSSPWLAMTTMLGLAFLFFFMRALYFAPFGEMGLPPRFSGSVIAVAAFIIYLPSTFAYLLWGFILDNSEGIDGYRYLFVILAFVSVIGVIIAHRLKDRLAKGAAKNIAVKIKSLDESLRLGGEEKTLSDQTNR